MSVRDSEKENPKRCCETSTSEVSEGEGGEAAAPFCLLFLFILAARNIFHANCLFNLVKFIVLLNVMVEFMLVRAPCIPVNTLTQLFRISPQLIAQQHVLKYDFHLCGCATRYLVRPK